MALGCPNAFQSPMTLDDCRRFYAQEIRFAASLRSPRLIEAFARVPREKFLGPAPWHIPQARSSPNPKAPTHELTEDPRDLYHNILIAIDPAKSLNNGQPGALALWIDALKLKPGDRVFHLGCGVGYYTAIMAEVVGPTGSVVAIEALSELAARAGENLAGYAQVTVHTSDGRGFETGRCDAVFINAGITHIDPAWLQCLADMGRLIFPLTTGQMNQPAPGPGGLMIRVMREAGGFSAGVVSAVAMYPCSTMRDRELDVAVGKAMRAGRFTQLKSVRCDAHAPVDTCIVHAPGACLSAADVTRFTGGS